MTFLRRLSKVLVGVFFALSGPGTARAAQIYVTTLEDKISTTGGCSLKEAVYSANFHSNVAIDGYNEIGRPNVIVTQCVAGDQDSNTIVLPAGATLLLKKIVDDAPNPFGPTATPMVTSNLTIEANGSVLQFNGPISEDIAGAQLGYFRAFAVGSSGHLTLRNAYIRDFRAQGGSTAVSGGGGLGAGGAIYVKGSGSLTVESSTFEGNAAVGGNGGIQGDLGGAGGGGMGGNGNPKGIFIQCAGGGGGGGSRGNGAITCIPGAGLFGDGGTGGGGTVTDGYERTGGFDCGGDGGDGTNGQDAPCDGGGGGGGGRNATGSGDGGKGAYGGGGGGGGLHGGNGGDGGFGGGGGGGWSGIFGGTRGGSGGFGGGGGVGPDGTLGGGHPGAGGLFGGNANALNGGGGAGLGGALFSDGGSVVVRNSTFYNNAATRGLGGGALGLAGSAGPADNGADAGGAIFSRNGVLEVDDATLSGNQGTGSGAGIVVVGDGATASFTLNNTILASNGAQECFVGGPVAAAGAGNLITSNGSGGSFGACPGVVTSSDPALGPLQVNAPGNTPTMAISQSSPAWNTADSGTSLAADQRGMPRTTGFNMGAPDIGAFELCLQRFGPFIQVCQLPPPILITEPLTIQVTPAGGGITNPAAGDYNKPENSVVLLHAAASAGYSFLGWTGNVGDPNSVSTSVVMNMPQTVTANFVPGTTTLGGNILTKSGPQNARIWPISISNAGVVVAHSARISSFSLTQTSGAACTPFLLTVPPVIAGDLAPGNSTTVNLAIDFTGCAATARFTAQATFSANGGGVTGSMTRTNQFQ